MPNVLRTEPAAFCLYCWFTKILQPHLGFYKYGEMLCLTRSEAGKVHVNL